MDQKTRFSGASFVANVLEIIHLLFHGKLDFIVKLCTYIEAKSFFISHVHVVRNFLEQKLRCGLVLGRLAVLKNKKWATHEYLLGAVFMAKTNL